MVNVAVGSELAKFGNTMINRNWKRCTLRATKYCYTSSSPVRGVCRSPKRPGNLHISPVSLELLRRTYPIYIFLFNKSTLPCRANVNGLAAI